MIYHILERSAVAPARERGEYRAASLATEGFMHCSQLQQVLPVANAFYAGRSGLALLEIDAARLHAALRYEAPVHPHSADGAPADHELFPHLYGALNFDAVVRVLDLPAGADGKFTLPVELRSA
jgi:uncharacterized protein (DUF952 family)